MGHQVEQHLNNKGPRRRKERERDRNLFQKVMAANFPNLGKETDI